MSSFRETQVPDLDEPVPADGNGAALRKTFAAAAALAGVALVPYAIPGAEGYRVWAPGDPPPFADHFRTDTGGPGVAEAGGHVDPTAADEGTRKALEIAAHADRAPAPKLVVEPAPAEARKAPEPAAGTEVRSAPEVAAVAAAPKARIRVPAEAHAGVEVLVEDPKGAMRAFYEALERTARSEPGAVTRISHWGDSAIAADGMTSASRRLLQGTFGDAGHGFVLAASGTEWYRHKDVRVDAAGWKALKIIDDVSKDGLYGYGGVQARGYLGARASFGTAKEGPVGTRVSRFDVYYRAAPEHGRLALDVDGGDPEELDTNAAAGEDRVHTVRVPDGPHALHVKALSGPVRVYGVALEREVPGVVYDSLGLVGARSQRLLHADSEHFSRQIALRRPDLMIVMFGGNELADEGMNMRVYRDTFREVVRRFRTARPEASCLVMSPVDHGEKVAGNRIRTVPMLVEMMAVQREVGLEEGCAFYSLFDAMGGEGSMGRWFRTNPRLGWGDLAHVTPEGAKVLGDLFVRALMKGFSDHLDRSQAEP